MDDAETRKKIVARAIHFSKLPSRGKKGEKVVFAVNQETPYTGWSKKVHGNGQAAALTQYKEGKQDGEAMAWYHNGQKRTERTMKDGKIMSLVGWKLNGEKCPHSNVVNGNGIWVWYNEKGQLHRRHLYKDGIRVKTLKK